MILTSNALESVNHANAYDQVFSTLLSVYFREPDSPWSDWVSFFQIRFLVLTIVIY